MGGIGERRIAPVFAHDAAADEQSEPAPGRVLVPGGPPSSEPLEDLVSPLRRHPRAGVDDLTDREREILGLLAQGKRNDDIARELYISPQTVQTHVRNILGKLRVHSKLEAVSFAVKHGAIQVG